MILRQKHQKKRVTPLLNFSEPLTQHSAALLHNHPCSSLIMTLSQTLQDVWETWQQIAS